MKNNGIESMSLNYKFILSILKALLVSFPFLVSGQSHNYWTRSFNEESSLLSGAVVGGGSGPSAIYYNPASISEVQASKFSLNASLFSFDFINVKNALGDGIDLDAIRSNVEPRFISYMIKSKKHPGWSFEIAGLNNENAKTELIESVDTEIDILTGLPGNERYFAVYQYVNHFRDDWVGFGGSVKVGDRLFLGACMFVTFKTVDYLNSLDIAAYPLEDSIGVNYEPASFYSASYQSYEYLTFNDYRLLFKGGMLYETESFSIGLSLTSPSIGVYSDG
jgi:hypothetical protein